MILKRTTATLRVIVGLVVAAGLLLGTTATASASAPRTLSGDVQAASTICLHQDVSFRNIVRGHLEGCFTSGKDGNVPYVEGTFEVCDVVDEPAETNIVVAELMVGFTNGSSWQYGTQPGFDAGGDGGYCSYYYYYQPGPAGAAWNANYLRVTVTAPGKNASVERYAF